MSKDLFISIRAVLASLVVCSVLYPVVVLAFARVVMPEQASGSLIRSDRGEVVGSRLIAQGFTRAEYLWPRPSAVAYNAAATGGSNLGPSNPALTERATAAVSVHEATPERPVPAELVAASGSGMDPHVTLAAALYQVPRIARARSVPEARVEELLRQHAVPVPFAPPLVNVLEANLELDKSFGRVAR
jgi:K+-transporting ATPase ATPase C chain